jgi:hypothetical protein
VKILQRNFALSNLVPHTEFFKRHLSFISVLCNWTKTSPRPPH